MLQPTGWPSPRSATVSRTVAAINRSRHRSGALLKSSDAIVGLFAPEYRGTFRARSLLASNMHAQHVTLPHHGTPPGGAQHRIARECGFVPRHPMPKTPLA
jgi:hypothetical protein